jgi:iron complex transport system ATP-binding protein
MTLATTALEVRYGTRAAVRSTSLALGTSGFVALVGPNGAGKSSLLRALAGLASYSGAITWQGRAIDALAPRERARTIAYLAQAPTVHWPLRAREVVALGRLPFGAFGTTDGEAVEWALAQTATAAFAERSVGELSVGERARVLLARALAVRAPVLLVDEPIAMLDPFHQLEVMGVLARYASGAGGAPALVVAVLHDLTLAARFCGRVLLMAEGSVAEDGAPGETLRAENVRRYYHVEPFVTEHAGEPVIVPWRPLGAGARDEGDQPAR